MSSSKQFPKLVRQRGAALIVALLVVATVVILATTLSSDFLLMFRRVENQLHSEQAYAYLLGAEGVARAALLQAEKQKKGFTALGEDWEKPQKFPTDYGWIAGQLEDVQGRFNLNSLVKAPAGTNGAAPIDFTEHQLFFIRLLLALPLPEPLAPDQAEALMATITDWVDADNSVTGLSGAESEYYADADPPSRPANRPMASPSELMWVKGMTPEIYRALKPLVTVWPKDGSTININTAPAGVLRAINAAGLPTLIDELAVEKLIQERQAKQHLDVAQLGSVLGIALSNEVTPLYGITSYYFELTAQTEFQGRRYTLHSILKRSTKDIRVIARTFGEW